MKDSRRYCNFLKDDLGEAQLGMLKLELQNAVSKLSKTLRMEKQHDEERSQQIKIDCDKLR